MLYKWGEVERGDGRDLDVFKDPEYEEVHKSFGRIVMELVYDRSKKEGDSGGHSGKKAGGIAGRGSGKLFS